MILNLKNFKKKNVKKTINIFETNNNDINKDEKSNLLLDTNVKIINISSTKNNNFIEEDNKEEYKSD